MSLPLPPNYSCDVYRSGNAPPSTPDAAGVRCYLMPTGQSSLTTPNFTHVLYLDATVDVRDNYIASSFSAGTAPSLDLAEQRSRTLMANCKFGSFGTYFSA